jgi:beta-galactosidase
MNGANTAMQKYLPELTSYDYDAPLSEAGDITPKYQALRRVIGKYTPLPDLPLPAPAQKLDLGPVAVTGGVSLWDALPGLTAPVRLPSPEPMETLDQNYGFILYRAHLRGPQAGKLTIFGLHDRAQVFQDGHALGVLTRNKPWQKIAVRVPPAGAQLDILVENMGRVNFGPHLIDRKGIVGGVMIGQHYVFDWEVYCLPLEDLSKLDFNPLVSPFAAPAFYRAGFDVDTPKDTFLALPGWTKGVAWVNGFNLGRYWKIGPQKTLYVPAPVLRQGRNELVVFELHGTKKMQAELRSRPKL